MAWLGSALIGIALPLAAGWGPTAPVQEVVPLPADAVAGPVGTEPQPDILDLAMLDQRMTVPVTIGGNADYRFVIDTGAERTVIARDLAARLQLAPGPDVRLVSMTGQSDVGTVRIPAFGLIKSGKSRSLFAPALSGRHLGAPGLLGVDMLAGHRVAIDMDRGTMTVRPSRARTSRNSPNEIVVQAHGPGWAS